MILKDIEVMVRNIFAIASQLKWARNRARKESDKLYGDFKAPELSKEQMNKIQSVWGKVHVDSKWMSFFNHYREEGDPWSPCYVPANLHYGIIDLFYSSNNRCSVIEDKNLNNLIYSGVKQPKTIMRCLRNGASGKIILLDDSYKILDDCQALRILENSETFICKPSIASGGGKNITFLDSAMSPENKLNAIKSLKDTVVQEIVGQHTSLSALNANSLNTMRLVTFITQEGDVRLLSAVMRMGVGTGKLDNAHFGGIFAGIDDKGCLRATAHNLKGASYKEHPTSGITFKGHSICSFQKCKEAVIKLAPRFYGSSRLISWDMTVDSEGDPLIIESNMNFGGCDIPQIANGPLFGDYTETMIKEVFSNRNNVIKSWLM